MKNFIKNILLLVAVLVLSYYTAEYFGTWYDKFVPQYGSSFLGTGKESALFIAGFPFAYVFFLTLLFKIAKISTKWTLILLIPPTLLWILADIQHIYLPVILGLIGFGIGKIINISISKLKQQSSN